MLGETSRMCLCEYKGVPQTPKKSLVAKRYDSMLFLFRSEMSDLDEDDAKSVRTTDENKK